MQITTNNPSLENLTQTYKNKEATGGSVPQADKSQAGLPTASQTAQSKLVVDAREDGGSDSRQSIQDKVFSEKETKQVMEFLNELSSHFNFKLEFHVHEETNRIFTKVINPETDEVLREIPPEEMLDMLGRIGKMIEEMAGVFLNRYV